MEAKKLIDALDGCQAVANILNERGLKFHSRQRIHNWYKKDAIPAWAQVAYPDVWENANKMINK